MIIRDVNNYYSVYENGGTKGKGLFEIEPLEKHKTTHLHKNKSNLIIAKAVVEYFIKGTNPETYIKNHRNIYDFCSGVKLREPWVFQEYYMDKGEVIKKSHKKILRYYVSNKGSKLIKFNTVDERIIQLEAGQWMQTIFNKYEEKPWDEYDINYQYYLSKIYNEINNIKPEVTQKYTQLSMF